MVEALSAQFDLLTKDTRTVYLRMLRLTRALVLSQELVAKMLERDGSEGAQAEAEGALAVVADCQRFLARLKELKPDIAHQPDGDHYETLFGRDDAQALLALAFENSPLGMTLSRLDNATPGDDAPRPEAILINRAFAQMLGYRVEDLLHSNDQSRFTHEDDRARDVRHVQDLLMSGGESAHWDKRYVHADGHVVLVHVSASVLRGPHGEPRYLIAQIRDVTGAREHEARLLDRADRDALTGLFNRSAFERHAREQATRCARYGESATLLLLDVDGLKQINDTLGHLAGDRALIAIADALRGRLREGDVAARIGGDEYVVLLPHTDRRQAQQLADEIRRTIETQAIDVDAGMRQLGVSIGAAEINQRFHDIASALAEADHAMYGEKRQRVRGATTSATRSAMTSGGIASTSTINDATDA